MNFLYAAAGFGILVIAIVLVSKQAGKSEAKRKQAEVNAKEARNDAEISSKPYIDNPLDLM